MVALSCLAQLNNNNNSHLPDLSFSPANLIYILHNDWHLLFRHTATFQLDWGYVDRWLVLLTSPIDRYAHGRTFSPLTGGLTPSKQEVVAAIELHEFFIYVTSGESITNHVAATGSFRSRTQTDRDQDQDGTPRSSCCGLNKRSAQPPIRQHYGRARQSKSASQR